MSNSPDFDASTARFGLPYLFAGQAQKEFTVNEALARIDALLHPSVIDVASDVPSSPEAGDTMLVAVAPTGEFAGHADDLATWDGHQWTFVAPADGMCLYDATAGQWLIYRDGWQRFTAPLPPSGGASVDAEARQAIVDLIDILKSFGIFS